MEKQKIRIVSLVNKHHRREVDYGVDESGSIVKLKKEPLSALHPRLLFDNDGWYMWSDNMPQ